MEHAPSLATLDMPRFPGPVPACLGMEPFPLSSPPLIDAHAHIMPDRLARAIRRFFDDRMGWGRLAYPDVLLADVVAAEAEAGVAGFWALPYAHKPGVAQSINQWMHEHVASLAGAVAGATFHPEDEDLPVLAREAFDTLGLRVAKLHCSVGRFAADDPRLAPVWEAARAHGVPVVVHAGHDVNGETAPHELEPIGRVASRYPILRLIVAHCGAPHLDTALDMLERHPSLHADLTGTAQWQVPLPTARLERLADRLLFGSDCPNTMCSIAASADWIRAARLSPEALAKILGGTARRLIPPAPPAA